jgi:tripartite-type tricarboxylate transporter receptor subunit TctC
MTDIADIMTFAKYNNALAVRVDAPLNSYEDVIAYAKKYPGKFTYATAGVGTLPHIVAERMAMKEGFKWTHVPFKSGPEGVGAVLGGHVDGVFMGSADIVPHVKANKLKVLLITSDTRWPSVPNISTILEKGYDFYHMSFISIYGQKDLPEPIRQKLEQAFKNAMKDPNFVERINNFQLETAYLSGKEYSAKWRSDYPEMGKILNALGLIQK